MSNVLITAGAAGIGRAMAAAFAERGDAVWVVDINEANLVACPGSWRQDCLDVTDESAVSDFFNDCARNGTHSMCCVPMPESPGRSVPVEALSLEDWRRCISVSLDGTFLFSKQAAVMMKVARSGALVITSSTAGLFGFRCRSPYVTAKWGVIGLMKTLAAELGPFNIRANAICPVSVDGKRMERVLEHED